MGKVSIPEQILRKEQNSLNIEEKALLMSIL